MDSMLDCTIADLEELATGRIELSRYGAWQGGETLTDGSIASHWVAYTPDLDQIWDAFRSAGYDPHARLDYVTWQDRFKGNSDRPEVIATMSRDDLRHLVVRFGRGERFCDGYLLGLLRSGAFLAALKRIRELN